MFYNYWIKTKLKEICIKAVEDTILYFTINKKNESIKYPRKFTSLVKVYRWKFNNDQEAKNISTNSFSFLQNML